MGEIPEYDIKELEKGIERAKKNIEVFEEACENERKTIKEYRHMIDVLEQKIARKKN